MHDKIKNIVAQTIDEEAIYYKTSEVRKYAKKGVCQCMVEAMGTLGNRVLLFQTKTGIRRFTPKECFKLQGYPTGYDLSNLSDKRLYQLIGCSCAIPCIRLVMKRILKIESFGLAVCYNINYELRRARILYMLLRNSHVLV